MKETKLRFFRFTPCEDGYMAHMETTGGINIPVNVYADPGTDFFLHAGQRCSFPLRGIASARVRCSSSPAAIVRTHARQQGVDFVL